MDVTAYIGFEHFQCLSVFVMSLPVHDQMEVLTGVRIGELLNEPLEFLPGV